MCGREGEGPGERTRSTGQTGKKIYDALYPPALTNKALFRRAVISSVSAGGKGREAEAGESKRRQTTVRRLGGKGVDV